MSTETVRQPAETEFRGELDALIKAEKRAKPPGWLMSPQSVVTYLMGGKVGGTAISPKYIGNKRLIETAVATLATDRALLLLGVPGTAKSWVSEHIAAAVSGSSQLLVQCTAGTDETQIRYGWNYAQLLAKGPSKDAIVPTPLMRGMRDGKVVRFEELTRMGSDVQDTLITVLSEKVLPIPELDDLVAAKRGFNIIGTANNRDKGVNELSAALKRRFNVVVLPLPPTVDEEASIVTKRVGEIGQSLQLPPIPSAEAEIRRVVTIFRELREGETLVIHTIGMNSDAHFPVEQFAGVPALGHDAAITERIHLVSPDLLEIDAEMTAPALFTAPYTTHFRYRRDRNHQPEPISYCVHHDRSIDAVSGKQRLDLTPPDDLPPPPRDP